MSDPVQAYRSRLIGCCIGVAGLLLGGHSAAAQDLAAGKAAWEATGIDDYEYSYQRVCECHPDIPVDTIVTVRDGKVVAVRYARKDYLEDVVLAADRVRWFRTIDDLFTLVESAQSRAAVVRAEFGSPQGYPTAIYIDYDADLVGDELDLKITSFTPAR